MCYVSLLILSGEREGCQEGCHAGDIFISNKKSFQFSGFFISLFRDNNKKRFGTKILIRCFKNTIKILMKVQQNSSNFIILIIVDLQI